MHRGRLGAGRRDRRYGVTGVPRAGGGVPGPSLRLRLGGWQATGNMKGVHELEYKVHLGVMHPTVTASHSWEYLGRPLLHGQGVAL